MPDTTADRMGGTPDHGSGLRPNYRTLCISGAGWSRAGRRPRRLDRPQSPTSADSLVLLHFHPPSRDFIPELGQPWAGVSMTPELHEYVTNSSHRDIWWDAAGDGRVENVREDLPYIGREI